MIFKLSIFKLSIASGLTIAALTSFAQQKTGKPIYDFSYLDNKISGWVDSGYYKGASIIIIKNNKLLHHQYFGNYRPQTVAYIASSGKWLASATIAAVVDEGKLSWNDKVKKWLPQFKDIKGEATLRQLLSHTAGYPAYQPIGNHSDDYQTLKQSVSHLVDLPADTLPGSQFKYGGLAMQVAGRMAEVATGKTWETIFQEKIAKPMHMRFTHFTPVSPIGGPNPMLAGGARTTLQDYADFLNMIINQGLFHQKRILSAKSITEMEADQIGRAELNDEYVLNTRASRRKNIYGLGEWREETDGDGNATLISSPSWAGAYPWIDKKNQVYGFFLARVSENKNGFNSFYTSPVLPLLVRDVLKIASHPEVKHGYADVGGAKLYYEESGKGETVIFLHGHSFDNSEWDPQFFIFAKKYHVVRYDLRGYGKSTMPVEGNIFLHYEDLYNLMNKLNIAKAHIIGLSLGGFVVTDFLAMHPDKLLSVTAASGDIFNVPGPDIILTDRDIESRHTEINAYKKNGIELSKRQWFNALTIRNGKDVEKIRKPVWDMIYKWDAWQPLHIECRSLLGNSVIAILKNQKVTVPVMVLTGNIDITNHNKLISLVPSAKQVIVSNAGHVSNLENPDGFNNAVFKFLSNPNFEIQQ